jgi:hypothetical protein
MAVHGKRAYIAIGVLTSLTDIGRDTTQSRSTDMADASHYGIQDKQYVAGMSDGTFSVSGLFTAAQDAMLNDAWDALNDGTLDSLTFVFGPEGNADGKVRYESEVLITSYEVSASIGDLVQASLNLQRTGATTRSVFAA